MFRLFIHEKIFAFLGVAAALYGYGIWNVSSGEHANSDMSDGTNIPPLDSSSSSESRNTFRNVIMAEDEAEIYARIRNLENQHYYNLPPQNNPGDYERLVRDNFDQALTLNVSHYR